MNLDAQLFLLLNSIAGKSPMLDGAIVFLASYLPYVLGILFLVFLLTSQYARREKIQIFLVASISAALARGGIVEGIRYFYHRPRPFSVLPTHQLLTDTAWSFPSGHATFFFALGTALYFYNKRWGSVFLAATVLITVSRIIAGIHYPSDIITGAGIGVCIAYLTFRIAVYWNQKQAHYTY